MTSLSLARPTPMSAPPRSNCTGLPPRAHEQVGAPRGLGRRVRPLPGVDHRVRAGRHRVGLLDPATALVDDVRRHPNLAATRGLVGEDRHPRPRHQRVALVTGPGEDAMRKVVLERGPVRLEGGVVGRVEVEES